MANKKSEIRAAIDARFLKSYRLLYADEKVQMKKEFCEKAKLLPQNFSMLEHGDLSCTVDNIYNLSKAYGISLRWLFFGEGDFYANA